MATWDRLLFWRRRARPGRQPERPETDPGAGADGDTTEVPCEGGRTWRQEPGYGERVLDGDRTAAEEEAEHVDRLKDHRRRPDTR